MIKLKTPERKLNYRDEMEYLDKTEQSILRKMMNKHASTLVRNYFLRAKA